MQQAIDRMGEEVKMMPSTEDLWRRVEAANTMSRCESSDESTADSQPVSSEGEEQND